jgi:hypothetical protein
MDRHEIRVQGWQSCQPGACDRHAPRGPIRFSNVRFYSPNQGRTETRFDVSYDGWHARCAQVQEPDRIFTCTIAGAAQASYELVLQRGCMLGAAGPAGRPEPQWTLHTSHIRMGRSVAPHREVSLVGDDGVVALAEVAADDNLDVFTPRGRTPSSGMLLMLVSVPRA